MSTPASAPVPVLPAVRPEVVERPTTGDGDGDHDRFAHYVARRDLERFQRTGRPVTALCGKRWRPDADPSRFPMCPTCAEIAADRLVQGLG